MTNTFRVGQKVSWHWGRGAAHGKVTDRFDRRVQRTIKGSKIVKVGTKENPAYLVEQEDGGKALKRGSELSGD